MAPSPAGNDDDDPMNSYWPDDVDGDAMRRLEAGGFDFDASYDIDFDVDFDAWPPAPAFIERLKASYPRLELQPPENDVAGYVRFVIEAKLSYELVVFVQESVAAIAAPYGGRCESWGVLH